MSTNNMAASWRQANDVIAPGWYRRMAYYQYIMEVDPPNQNFRSPMRGVVLDQWGSTHQTPN